MKFGTFYFIVLLVVLGIFSCTESSWEIEDALQEEHTSILAQKDNLKKNKCEICHNKGGGTFKKKSISCNAIESHLNHGDGLIGDPVPGNDGFIFGEDCELVEIAEECPCFTMQEVVDIMRYIGNYCEGSSRIQVWNRGVSAMQDFTAMQCQLVTFSGSSPITATSTGEASACQQIIQDIIAQFGHGLNHYPPSCE